MNRHVSHFLAPVLIAVVTVAGCERSRTQSGLPAAAVDGVASLDFEINDKRITEEVGIVDGETLETTMRSLNKVDVEMSGSGTTAYVNSINGVESTGSEGWTFEIDGEWADKGVGSTKLHPPTTINWKYGEFAPSEK